MITLYGLLLLMMVSALYLLAIPFIKKKAPWRVFFIITLAFSGFAFSIYYYAGNKNALALWLAEGKGHYQLQTAFDELGGVDGVITQIKNKLAANPEDVQGWSVLAKLYLAKGQKVEAQAAFDKVKILEKNRPQRGLSTKS